MSVDTQVIGVVISSSASGGTTYFGPWFSSEGNAAVFTVDLFDTTGLQSFQITAQTKTAEEDDSGASAVGGTTSVTLTAGNRHTFSRGNNLTGTGFKELVRFKYEVSQESTPSELGYVHFRMLSPSWMTE